MALFGRAGSAPFLGEERKWPADGQNDAIDPKETWP
jgi:hypothetical protein